METNNLEKGKLILSDLNETYINYSLIQNQNKLKKGLEFLNSQFKSINEQIVDSNNKLRDFQKKHNFYLHKSHARSIPEASYAGKVIFF